MPMMALRWVLGVAYLALCAILTTTMAMQGRDSSNQGNTCRRFKSQGR